MAFEPEHAIVFARPGIHGPDELAEAHKPENGSVDASLSSGYLHTYKTKNPLRLVYLDGASAAKSNKGTLELQDLVLLRESSSSTQSRASENEQEHSRASRMCQIASREWDDQIDGFVRMEAGFEIILCNFEKHLDVVRITRTKPNSGAYGAIPDASNYFKAIASRYHGLGGDRLTLDYDNYISLFSYPGAVYFDLTGRPRVDNSSADIAKVRESLTSIVLKDDSTPKINWQVVTDTIVARYADRIDHLASGTIQSLEEFKTEADLALRPFIDYGNRNMTKEIGYCREHPIPLSGRNQQSTAALAILEVSDVVCRSLSLMMRPGIDTLSDGVSLARTLRKWLAWTEWKKCKSCSSNEFCFVPIWPAGSAEDFDQPRCISDVKKVGRDYWGRDTRRLSSENSSATALDQSSDQNSSIPLLHVGSDFELLTEQIHLGV